MTVVLVVDDEPLVRLAVRSLEDWGAYGIDFAWEAADGAQALELVAAHPEIDVVLADVDMPVMNGLELAEALKERGAAQDLLFLSSFDTFEFARRAFKAGADDYILKSEMDEGRLLAALRKLADRRGAASGGTRPRTERAEAFLSLMLAPKGSAATAAEPELRVRLPATLLLVRPSDGRLVAERYGADPSALIRVVVDLMRQSLLLRGSGEILALSSERYLAVFDAAAFPAEDTAGNAVGDAGLFFEDFARAARNYLGLDFEARSAGPVESWEGLRDAYAEAEGRFSSASRLVVRARRYVRDHYAEPALDLAAIAAFAEVSKNHLSWEFSRETGENLSAFIARVRVEAAMRLLSDTNLKTYEIAERVGFSNVETFCRVFKKTTGTTARGFVSN